MIIVVYCSLNCLRLDRVEGSQLVGWVDGRVTNFPP